MMRRSATPRSLSSLTLFHFTSKPLLLPKTLNYIRRFTSAPTTANLPETTRPSPSPPPHPWPEWVSFVDRLKTLGYFPPSGGGSEVYQDLSLLKDPCLSFAHDRYDIFQSVSRDDVRSIVEVGCPKLVRKVVNSAKRLRAYLGLEEKIVCDACSLKDSCDRAYLIPNEAEEAGTVDIMRLLLFYAVDPMVISGALRPPFLEQAESSARRLLRMLMELSEASSTSAPVELSYTKEKSLRSAKTLLSQDVERREGDWVCPKCSFLNFARNAQCRKCTKDVELKNGDWNCPKCSFLNFARNSQCRNCNVDRPEKRERAHVEPKTGDWVCSECNFFNFWRNFRCRKCDGDGPRVRSQVKFRAGDWNCPQCGCINFSSRSTCFHCTGARPPHTLNDGEWLCSKCNYLNFRRNVTCLKCGGDHSNKVASEPEPTWREPAAFVAE